MGVSGGSDPSYGSVSPSYALGQLGSDFSRAERSERRVLRMLCVTQLFMHMKKGCGLNTTLSVLDSSREGDLGVDSLHSPGVRCISMDLPSHLSVNTTWKCIYTHSPPPFPRPASAAFLRSRRPWLEAFTIIGKQLVHGVMENSEYATAM